MEGERKSKELANYTTEEKILRYGFSPDRADVIDHSLEIYDVICTNLEIEKITSTKWGISDSIAVKLFHEIYLYLNCIQFANLTFPAQGR